MLRAAPTTLDPGFGGGGVVQTAVSAANRDDAFAAVLQTDGKLIVVGGCLASGFRFCAVRYLRNGSPDTSFNGSGKTITQLASDSLLDEATAVAVQADGKIVLAGFCFRSGSNYRFCALRYNADGSLDLSFNGSGTVITAAADSDADFATALRVQPDGKLLVAGYCHGANYAFCAVRYNADGSLDVSFNGSGRVMATLLPAADSFANALAVQPDGKIVLAGSCWNGANYDFCAMRYLADGSLDPTFGSGGKAIHAVTTTANDFAAALTLQPDAKIVLAGRCVNLGNEDFCAQRYHADGTLDAGFNGSGTLITPITASASDGAAAVAVQADGKLLLAGQCSRAGNIDFCAARYHEDGSLDLSFGSGGKVITSVSASANDLAAAMLVQADGKIVVAGSCGNGSDADFCAIRYQGGPFAYTACSLDIDGDGRVLATTDSLIHARVVLGISGAAVASGISFPATATRNTWPLIRDYLVTQCGMTLLP